MDAGTGTLFKGRTVLVTGAAAGIGRAIALAAGREGANLVLGDVAAAGLSETASLLERDGVAAITGVCDIRKHADLSALFAAAETRFGFPDVVFANAGILGSPTPVWEYSEADFTRIIEVNAIGTWRTLRTALQGMVKRRSGVIVATASVAGLVGAPGVAAYVASKHAVVGLVKTAALEVAALGIRINALCPGMVDTPMLDGLAADQPELREALMAINPSRRIATADEIANAAVWLGSDRATFVTGHTLAIDGGFIAQ